MNRFKKTERELFVELAETAQSLAHLLCWFDEKRFAEFREFSNGNYEPSDDPISRRILSYSVETPTEIVNLIKWGQLYRRLNDEAPADAPWS